MPNRLIYWGTMLGLGTKTTTTDNQTGTSKGKPGLHRFHFIRVESYKEDKTKGSTAAANAVLVSIQ